MASVVFNLADHLFDYFLFPIKVENEWGSSVKRDSGSSECQDSISIIS